MKAVRVIKYKRLTDEHLLYIFNHVIIPRIDYRMLLTVLSPDELHKSNLAFRSLLKNKIHMSSRAPDYITQCAHIYKAVSLADHQLHSITVNLQKCLNSPGLLGKITHIRCL